MTQKYQKAEDVNHPTAEVFKAEEGATSKLKRQENSSSGGKINKTSFSDDSDLASLAREFEEEEHFQESPFIRKVNIGTAVNNAITFFQ